MRREGLLLPFDISEVLLLARLSVLLLTCEGRSCSS